MNENIVCAGIFHCLFALWLYFNIENVNGSVSIVYKRSSRVTCSKHWILVGVDVSRVCVCAHSIQFWFAFK